MSSCPQYASLGTAELHIRYFETCNPWSYIIDKTTMLPSECAMITFSPGIAAIVDRPTCPATGVAKASRPLPRSRRMRFHCFSPILLTA